MNKKRKTILVVGEVTAKQYHPARLHLMRQGYLVDVTRIEQSELRPKPADLLRDYAWLAPSEIEAHLGTNPILWVKDCARRHFEQFGKIGGIVVSHKVYGEAVIGDHLWDPDGTMDTLKGLPLWHITSEGELQLVEPIDRAG